AFRESQQRLRRAPHRCDRAVEPRSGGVHGHARAYRDLALVQGIAHASAGDAIAVAHVPHHLRVIEHERAVLLGVDEVLYDEALDERDLRVVETPRAEEAVWIEVRLRLERRGTVKPLPFWQ